MNYYKLIALQIDDFCSSIFFEDNYGLEDMEKMNRVKKDLESRGYVCITAKTTTNIQ